eukprot:scaffold62892_cov122-Phaeocystis_antarctica.AAC.1
MIVVLDTIELYFATQLIDLRRPIRQLQLHALLGPHKVIHDQHVAREPVHQLARAVEPVLADRSTARARRPHETHHHHARNEEHQVLFDFSNRDMLCSCRSNASTRHARCHARRAKDEHTTPYRTTSSQPRPHAQHDVRD